MNSVKLMRTCVFVTLIRRNPAIKRVNTRVISYAMSNPNVNKSFGDPLSRPVTRSYSKQLNQEGAAMPLIVGHDKDGGEFYIKMTDDEKKQTKGKAVLTYVWERPKFADLQHTYVPEEFRGRGVAKLLAETAFEYFVSQGATMRLSCTYLQKYATEHENPRYMSKICWD